MAIERRFMLPADEFRVKALRQASDGGRGQSRSEASLTSGVVTQRP
jgi:hypothetical protein